MKKIKGMLLTILCVFIFSGCSKSNVQKIDINIGALKGPTSMGMIKIMEDGSNGEASNNYNFVIAGAADEIDRKSVV